MIILVENENLTLEDIKNKFFSESLDYISSSVEEIKKEMEWIRGVGYDSRISY